MPWRICPLSCQWTLGLFIFCDSSHPQILQWRWGRASCAGVHPSQGWNCSLEVTSLFQSGCINLLSHQDSQSGSSPILSFLGSVRLFFIFADFSSAVQLCPTLCDPMDYSMRVFPVYHQLLEFAQTYIHQVGDAGLEIIFSCGHNFHFSDFIFSFVHGYLFFCLCHLSTFLLSGLSFSY